MNPLEEQLGDLGPAQPAKSKPKAQGAASPPAPKKQDIDFEDFE